MTRALKLASEGEGEVAKLSAQASELDSTSTRTKARVVELEVRTLRVQLLVPSLLPPGDTERSGSVQPSLAREQCVAMSTNQ